MTTEVNEPVDNGGSQAPAGAESDSGKTFTQAEVDALIERRLSRTKAQYKDYDDLKASAQRLADLEAQNQTEAERLRAQAEKASKSAQESAERERAATERANTTLIRAAVISEAVKQKAIDPDAVYALLDKSQLTIGDGDQIDGVSDSVTALLEERSYLAGSRLNGGFDGGAQGPASPASSRADLNAQIRRQAGFA